MFRVLDLIKNLNGHQNENENLYTHYTSRLCRGV